MSFYDEYYRLKGAIALFGIDHKHKQGIITETFTALICEIARDYMDVKRLSSIIDEDGTINLVWADVRLLKDSFKIMQILPIRSY